MAKLKYYQIELIRGWFCPQPGYVLDFTNKTFAEFFEDRFEVNIYSDVFSEKGTSKFNRLLAFIAVSPPHLVIEVLKLLWDRRNFSRDDHIQTSIEISQRDVWSVDPEYVSALSDAATREDLPFKKLISEIASLPSHVGAPLLSKLSAEWTLDTVEREFSRAFENVDKDPEAAVTAASSLVESLCRSILVARNIPLPKKMDIQSLYKSTREPLGLSANKDIKNTEIEDDVRMILSALFNALQGIGALRTHSGTAHGREKGFSRLDPRIARLAVNAATATSLFIIETWEKRFPNDKLLSSQKIEHQYGLVCSRE